MNENNNSSLPPLMENEYVGQLFSVLLENGRDTSGLSALLGHVIEMESFVKRAEDKIADMKSQLAEMKEVQSHPVKTALQNAVKALMRKVSEVKERIGELKSAVTAGCKNAVAACKERGVSALDKMASFFHIKDSLQAIDRSAAQSIKLCDQSVANINMFANEYHSAGRAVKNMVRVAVGKQPTDAKKEAGKLARTISAPYKAQKSALMGLQKSIENMTAKLNQLENAAAVKQTKRTSVKKPFIAAKLEENKGRIEREKRELPTPERAKAQGLAV